MSMNQVTCEECNRQGTEGFVWFQGEIMLCADQAACNERRDEAKK